MQPIATTSLTPSTRARALKERLLAVPTEVDLERARNYTAAWTETEGVAPCMRAALALRETLRRMTIRIEDQELLAGVRTSAMTGIIVPVERMPELVFSAAANYVAANAARRKLVQDQPPQSQEEHDKLAGEMFAYWSGRTAKAAKEQLWKEAGLWDEEHQRLLPYDLGVHALDTQGHTIPGYRRVLELGFDGIAASAERRLSELEEGEEDLEHKRDFLASVPVLAEAVGELSERYGRLAEELAARAEEPRRTELLAIAERCRRVPAQPPRTFLEALQSLWMTHVVLCISYGFGDVFSIGRIDQYLGGYYRADLEAGRITPEQALELIEELHLKLATSVLPANYTLTLSGLSPEGEDATNDLSHLFLDALESIGGLKNNVSVRISPKTPRTFLLRAWRVHRRTGGIAFYNDEIVVRDLLADGYSLEDARDYSIVGCVEPTTSGKDFSYTAGNGVSIVQLLELALNEGRFFADEERRVGAPTPPVASLQEFEDVEAAYAEQLRYAIEVCVAATDLKDQAYADLYPVPLLSSTLIGCLESGKDATHGGARYNNGHIGTQGLGTVVNSLAAIRWAVFDQKLLTLPELCGHLRNDFEGAEELRLQLECKAPKYGNDDPETDAIAEWVVGLFCDEVRSRPCARGGVQRPLILSSGYQVAAGRACSATPDGRKAREPVTDGISPAHGSDRSGLTAVLHSAAKAGRALVSDGTTLTLNLSPGLLETEEGVEKMASVIEGYFELGGRHVQFTPVDTETLRDAQEHPEKYPDLTVKVSGFSAVFIDLPPSLQDDIIARTEFCEA